MTLEATTSVDETTTTGGIQETSSNVNKDIVESFSDEFFQKMKNNYGITREDIIRNLRKNHEKKYQGMLDDEVRKAAQEDVNMKQYIARVVTSEADKKNNNVISEENFDANDRLPYTFDQKEYERIAKEEGPEAAAKYADVNKDKKEAPKEKKNEVKEQKKETPKETKPEIKKEEKKPKVGFFKKTFTSIGSGVKKLGSGIKSIGKHTWNGVSYVPRTIIGTADMALNTVGLVGLPFNKKEGRKKLLDWYKGKRSTYTKKFNWNHTKEKK